MAIREKIKLKSMGLVTLGIFPIGAFAEPDEKQLEKATMKKRTRVYSAGSMTNFVFAAMFLAILIPANMMITPSLLANYQTTILEIEQNSPADIAGLKEGMTIYGLEFVNQEPIPNSPVTLDTNEGKITILRNEEGKIGVAYNPQVELISDNPIHWAKFYFLEIITWIGLLNLLVGMFNFLPFAIFDGARIFEDLVNFFNKQLGRKGKPGKTWLKITSIIVLITLVVNFLPYFTQ